MAIVRKNREFSKIMEDVEVITIPVRFIRKLTIFLEDNNEIHFDSEDLENLDSLETLLHNASFSDDITDMRVELDFSEIEKTITHQVKLMLDKKEND